MNDPHPLSQAIIAGRRKEIPELVQQCLDAGETAAQIVENRLVPGMAEVGERFKRNEIFVPEMLIVGSGYSYLQEWLPHVAQAVVRLRLADSIGLGRMVLSYPDLPADVASGRTLTRKKICRTFSDCTTAPRNGMVSGCYPLDPFYKARPDRDALKLLHEASRMEENEGVSFRATKSKLT